MTVGLKVEVDVREATAMFRRLGVALNARQILKGIGRQQVRWIDSNFRREGRGSAQFPTGKKWKELSRNTVAGRTKGSSAILQDDGRLKGSFETGQPIRLTATEVEVGTNVKYAAAHHFGTGPFTIRPKNKPLLKFITADGWRSARVVNHPGLPERPLLPSRILAGKMAAGLIEAGFRKAIAGR